MREHLDGLKGVEVIAGDFVLVGYCNTPAEWQDDHDRNVRAFLDRCYERNLKLNKNRARLKQHEVLFIMIIIIVIIIITLFKQQKINVSVC